MSGINILVCSGTPEKPVIGICGTGTVIGIVMSPVCGFSTAPGPLDIADKLLNCIRPHTVD